MIWPQKKIKEILRVGTYFLLLKMSMLDLSVNFSSTAMTLPVVAALLFRDMGIFFPLALALCLWLFTFWLEQNAGKMTCSRGKMFWWTSCFLKWYCFRKYASSDRTETIWQGIKYWAFYYCLFFGLNFLFHSHFYMTGNHFWVLHLIIYTTYLYLLFSFNPLILSVIPMWLFHYPPSKAGFSKQK